MYTNVDKLTTGSTLSSFNEDLLRGSKGIYNLVLLKIDLQDVLTFIRLEM